MKMSFSHRHIHRHGLVSAVLVILACMGGLPACTPADKHEILEASDATEIISGQIWFSERIALPAAAELSIEVKDVSKMDVPAQILASVTMSELATPTRFEFVLPRTAFIAGHTYAVGAKIMLNDKLLFINTQAYSLDPNALVPLSVMLDKVGS
ncbi:YbaY family lipoprotein [Shewanella sp. AS16]|uniref:YbaY family lipoprotein n=1 Tax=Shewanella sp. AS16 TaxID=2907625 RepID=UPI001F184DAF|nr:YbaY family lipoprotein [Shewanella sp. AS16]